MAGNNRVFDYVNNLDNDKDIFKQKAPTEGEEFLSIWNDPDKGWRGSKSSGQADIATMGNLMYHSISNKYPQTAGIDLKGEYGILAKKFENSNLSLEDSMELKGIFYSKIIDMAATDPLFLAKPGERISTGWGKRVEEDNIGTKSYIQKGIDKIREDLFIARNREQLEKGR